jgi:hypothetical protein
VLELWGDAEVKGQPVYGMQVQACRRMVQANPDHLLTPRGDGETNLRGRQLALIMLPRKTSM